MSFINTVDILGDEALSNSIIDRSIVEISDGNITKVGPRAFMSCGALKRADFLNVNIIEDRAFSNAAQLETLILREDSVSLLNGVNHFNGTKIVSGTGYIYVPAALVDFYKAASGWSTYASQIRAIEDYPEVCDPYSWVAVSKAIENGTYKDVYKIGDEVPVDLGSEGVINMQIAAFDADTLADGSGTAAISWVAKELLKTGCRMNPSQVNNGDGTYQEGTGAIGGWEKCEMRSYIQNTVKPLVPANVMSMISPVNKSHVAYDTTASSFNQTTAEDLWVPSANEIKNSTSVYGRLFPDKTSLIKRVGTTARLWATRDASGGSNFKGVLTSGAIGANLPTSIHFVCLGFCTGRTPA